MATLAPFELPLAGDVSSLSASTALSRIMDKIDELRDDILQQTNHLHHNERDALRAERDAARARCAEFEQRLANAERIAADRYAEIERARGIIDDAKLRLAQLESVGTVGFQRGIKLSSSLAAHLVVVLDREVTGLREDLASAERLGQTINCEYLRRQIERRIDLLAILDEHGASIVVSARTS